MDSNMLRHCLVVLLVGDLENDGDMEIVAMVTDTTQQTCYPAIYNINLDGTLGFRKGW